MNQPTRQPTDKPFVLECPNCGNTDPTDMHLAEPVYNVVPIALDDENRLILDLSSAEICYDSAALDEAKLECDCGQTWAIPENANVSTINS